MTPPHPELPEAEAPETKAPVWHYDGRSAHRWQARLIDEGESFRLIGEGWESGPWRWADLVALDLAGQEQVFAHSTEQGWRIGFVETPSPAIAAHLPRARRYGGIIDHIGWGAASVAFACIAALVLFIGMKVPAWIAPLVPQAWEDRLGDAIVGDFGGRYCHTAEGDAALRALARRVDPQGEARSIEVANIPMVNAVALPGRHIILFDGLLTKAESPDEVAGVLGHELGHVQHRDTMTALIRQMGLSVILGGMDGGAGSQLNALLGLSFSRDAEHHADEAAIAALKGADISPLPTARFFARMAPKEQDRSEQDKSKEGGAKDAGKEAGGEGWETADWFASHPSSRSRRALFEGAVEKGRAYRPALSPAQWQALRTMCGQDKTVKPAFDWGL